MYRIGIDLGGTTIAGGIINNKIELIGRLEIKTGNEKKGDILIDKIANLYQELINKNEISENDVDSVGIGVPGTANQILDVIEDANNLGLDSYPFIDKMKARISKKINFENDANTAALGEYYMGNFQTESFFMVTLGTGVGGGYIVNQKILSGINGALGEIGHMVIEMNGRQCNCGRRGCFERYASSSALVQDTINMVAKEKQGILWNGNIKELQNLDGKKIFDAYRKNDAIARKVVEQYVKYLGEGIVNVINILQPEILCIGGGISQASDCYLEQLQDYISKYRYSQNSKRNTKVIIASHGNDAGIVGAAMLD